MIRNQYLSGFEGFSFLLPFTELFPVNDDKAEQMELRGIPGGGAEVAGVFILVPDKGSARCARAWVCRIWRREVVFAHFLVSLSLGVSCNCYNVFMNLFP